MFSKGFLILLSTIATLLFLGYFYVLAWGAAMSSNGPGFTFALLLGLFVCIVAEVPFLLIGRYLSKDASWRTGLSVAYGPLVVIIMIGLGFSLINLVQYLFLSVLSLFIPK